jgi:5-methylcytosine-specific restriction enzyme subunit McrC
MIVSWTRGRDDYLPFMYTDITLVSDDRKIIIDTKFYGNTLSNGRIEFGANKFHSANLYQIYAYVSNVSGSGSHPMNLFAEGVLLYPTIDVELSEKYRMKNYPISVYTVNEKRIGEALNFKILIFENNDLVMYGSLFI